jgi:hypothetical protein
MGYCPITSRPDIEIAITGHLLLDKVTDIEPQAVNKLIVPHKAFYDRF